MSASDAVDAGTATAGGSVESNVALVRQFYEEIFNRANPAMVEEIVASGFIDHIPRPLPGQPTSGPDAIRWFLETARTAIPDLQVTVEDVIAAGDKVVARVTWQGMQNGPLMGADPTGKQMRFMGIDIVRISDGKLVEHWGQVDVLAAIGQLGFLPF